jgi:hypothetical protein
MARPTVTVPPVTILLEMAGYSSLTEWLARPLPKEHVRALSPEAKETRSGRGVQGQGPTRAAVEEDCRSRRYQGGGGDILDLSPRVLGL